MGSRRRPRPERSSVDLGLTTRVRDAAMPPPQVTGIEPDEPTEGEAAPEPQRGSAQHAALKRAQAPQEAARNVVTGQHARITTSGQHERLTASSQHERLTASGQQERIAKSRVELVTRQADDGSYELVYEEVSDDEGDEEMPLTAGDLDPFWRRQPMIAVAILVGVLVVGGLSVAGVAALLDREPKKIASTDGAPTDNPEQPGEQYEYVPPPNAGKQAIAPEDADAGAKTAKATATATSRTSGKPTPSPQSAVGNRALPGSVKPQPPKPSFNERPGFRDAIKSPVIPTPDKERLREALKERMGEEDDGEVIEESEEIPEEALENDEEREDEGDGEDAPEGDDEENLDDEENPDDENLDEEGPEGDENQNEDPEGEGDEYEE